MFSCSPQKHVSLDVHDPCKLNKSTAFHQLSLALVLHFTGREANLVIKILPILLTKSAYHHHDHHQQESKSSSKGSKAIHVIIHWLYWECWRTICTWANFRYNFVLATSYCLPSGKYNFELNAFSLSIEVTAKVNKSKGIKSFLESSILCKRHEFCQINSTIYTYVHTSWTAYC